MENNPPVLVGICVKVSSMGFDKGIQIQPTEPRLIAGHALGKVPEGEEITQEPTILIRSCATLLNTKHSNDARVIG